MRGSSESLSYGTYFGTSQIHHELAGFSASLLRPTLRAEHVPLHTHESASFVLVLSGKYLSSADGAAAATFRPTLIFNPAGTVHRDSFVLPHGRFLAVSISDQSLRVASDWAVLPPDAAAFTSGAGLQLGLRLAQQCALSDSASDTTMEALCWELLSILSGVSLWPDQQKQSIPSWTGRARELLHDRCSDSMRITDLAQQLGVHPVYFARAFRRVFRCTPGEYRARCRVRDALALMKDKNLCLSDIALSTGFFDQSHFTTSFRKHFGISPQAYRLRHHGHLPASKVQFIQEPS